MKKKILIIEDDPDIADLVEIHLRDLGYQLDHLNDHRLKVGGFKARLRRLKGKRLKDGGFRPRAKLPTVGLKPPIGKSKMGKMAWRKHLPMNI
jgi:hypothetical protein